MDFIKTRTNGEPCDCKFCHKPVWYANDAVRTCYEPGGTELHIDNCERRKQFFKNQAYDRADSRRGK